MTRADWEAIADDLDRRTLRRSPVTITDPAQPHWRRYAALSAVLAAVLALPVGVLLQYAFHLVAP